MVSITSAIIILLFLMGIIVGFKRGFIKQSVMFIGTLLVFFIAYFLKNPIASLFYSYLPFIEFNNVVNAPVLNILFYEALAFFIVAVILFAILNILIKFTSIFEKILNATIILGIPSKILGAVVGFLQYYVLIFIGLYFLSMPLLNLDFINESKLANTILNKTPILSNTLSKQLEATNEIIDLNIEYKDNINSTAYNLEAFEIMIKNKIITVKSADILIEKDKLDIPGAEGIINKYRGEK